jgi:Protein of unknown function (DUF3592)
MNDISSSTIVGWIVAVPIVLAFYGYIVAAVVLGRRSEQWPSTSGILDWFALTPGGRSLNLHVRYRYRVGGVEYVGTRYRIGEGFVGGATYPVGKPLDHWCIGMPLVVYHHPRNPRLATIDRGVPQGMWMVFWIFSMGGTVVGTLRLLGYVLKHVL